MRDIMFVKRILYFHKPFADHSFARADLQPQPHWAIPIVFLLGCRFLPLTFPVEEIIRSATLPDDQSKTLSSLVILAQMTKK